MVAQQLCCDQKLASMISAVSLPVRGYAEEFYGQYLLLVDILSDSDQAVGI
jgi:hypothetical protein